MASGSKAVIYAALVGNGLISITKFIAAGVTGSSAMFSEAIHSVVDTGNQVLLLWGLKKAAKPADEKHPLGYGKEIYFWSFVVSILIFALGSGISLYEGIHHVKATLAAGHGDGGDEEAKSYAWNYGVLGFAMVFEGAAWWFALRAFKAVKGKQGYLQAVKHGKDPSIFVVLFEDSAAMLGLFIAFVGVALAQWTGNSIYDGAASILIGVVLGAVAIWLAVETKGLLIGESASEEVLAMIDEILEKHEAVDVVTEVITLHMGPEDLLVAISAEFKDGLRVGKIEEAVSEINEQIKSAVPTVSRVFVEVEEGQLHRRQMAESVDH